MRNRIIAALIGGLVFGLIAGRAPAYAQEGWPSRPLTMVVPFAAGGPVDLLGRIVGQYLGAQLGTPVVIEFLRTHLVPRLPTAILATSLMLLAFLALASGLILDTVTRGRWELKRLAYLAIPGPQGLKLP